MRNKPLEATVKRSLRVASAFLFISLMFGFGQSPAAAQADVFPTPSTEDVNARTTPRAMRMDQAPQARAPLPRARAATAGFQGWQIEAHVGFMSTGGADGMGQLPAPQRAFNTFQGLPTRQIPSWYFGDGALLANQVASTIVDSPRITPLDAVLTTASAGRQRGASFGFRVGHSITRHVLAELNVDVGKGHVAWLKSSLAAIEATRASFTTYFGTTLRRNPNAGNASVGSTATIVDNRGSQLMVTGDVDIAVPGVAGMTPYVTVGGGFVRPRGDDLSVALFGQYDFTQSMPGSVVDGAPIDEADHLLVRYVLRSAVLTLVGGGIQRNISAHTGIRLDARLYIGATRSRIRIDAEPSSVAGTPSGRIVRGTGPQIQVSSTDGVPSSLSGSLNRFDTFDGTGNQFAFTAAYLLRF